MKAVIVEIRGNRAAALLEDGQFVSIPDSGYSIGQEITLLRREAAGKPKRSSFRQRAAAMAASAVLLLGLGGSGLAYAMPYGTVSMDVNPSIEYTINRFDRVLRVSGINEDGQAVLEAMGKSRLLNRKIEDAVTETISQLEETGYLAGEDDAIVFSSGTGSEAHSAALAASLEERFSPRAEVYSVAVTREEVASAHEKGTTAGKKSLADRIAQESPEGASPADWVDRPVNDLMQAFHHKTDPAVPEKPDGMRAPSEPQGAPLSPEEPASVPHEEAASGQNLPDEDPNGQFSTQPQPESHPEAMPDPASVPPAMGEAAGDRSREFVPSSNDNTPLSEQGNTPSLHFSPSAHAGHAEMPSAGQKGQHPD